MSAPDSEHTGDESLNDRGAVPAMKTITAPPNYAKLRAEYHHISAQGLLEKPLSRRLATKWAHARLDFEDALFELLPHSGLGTVILDPADRRTEHVRVTNAVITLHDWLRLYKEIIRQPPPEGLEEIERKLLDRRNELKRLYPPEAHQPD